jgi:hypothetical protein
MPDKRAFPLRFPARLGLHPQSRPDVGIALSLFLTGTLTGLLYCLFYAGAPVYYQKWFGPAVMFASGHGLVNPDTTGAPKIQEFLDLKRDRLSQGDIPADISTGPLTLYQSGHRYLLLSVGFWWRRAGISWRQVAAVNAVLYGLATASSYAIFRLAVRRMFALFGALLLCGSATQLENLVHLRDYAKAPFILASIAVLGTLALRAMPRRRLLCLCALGGTILGIGTGFRIDVAVLFPILVVGLLFFHADRPWHMLSDKLMALAVLALTFAGFAGPILATLSSTGSNFSHVILLGLTDPFDATLGVKGSIYGFGPYFNDTYMASVVGGYAERVHNVPVHISSFSPSTTYERMGSKYLLTLGREFPADMLTRFLGSVVAVLELPFAVFPNYHVNVRVPFQEPLARMYSLLSLLKGLGVPLAVLLLMGAAVKRLKYGLFGTFALLTLAGLSTLQFHLRHYFHLQFISLLSMLVAVDSLLLVAGHVIRRGRSMRGTSPWIGHARGRLSELWHTSWPQLATVFRSVRASRAAHSAVRAAGRVLLMGLLIASMSILPLWCLRRYQESHLTRLFLAYLFAEKQEVGPLFGAETPGTALITWDGAGGRTFGAGHYPTDYYMVEVVSERELAIGTIGLKYRATSEFYDLSRTIAVTFRKGTNQIFFPVYGIDGLDGSRQFIGLEVSEGLRRRLRGISRVTELKDKPLLLDLHLASGWEDERLFQALRRWEHSGSRGPMVYAAFQPGSVSGRGWIDSPESTALRADGFSVEWRDATMVKAEGRHILVDGRTKAPFNYLVQFKQVAITQGALLVARGRLERGRLIIGILKEDKWFNHVVIDSPGEFVAVVEVGEAGVFVPLITNAAESVWDRSRFTITDIGILDPKDPQ